MDRWPTQIAVDALYTDYLRASDEVGTKRKRDRATFGQKLAKLMPGLEKTRPKAETEPGVFRRVWFYALPPLQTCRDFFDSMMGQDAGWLEVGAAESEREGADAPSDEVPV